MRVMVFVKATEDSENGHFPEPFTSEMMKATGRFNDELREAGVLVLAEGLTASSKGKRVAFDGPGRTVIDGPFANPRELVAGFWLWEVQGYGRGGCLGEAHPQSHAGTQRDRNPADRMRNRFCKESRPK
jgi:hypothetical protein